MEEEEELVVQKKRLTEEGVIHGDNYEAYSVQEIMNIKNLDFMYKMYDELAERCAAIGARLNELLIENL